MVEMTLERAAADRIDDSRGGAADVQHGT